MDKRIHFSSATDNWSTPQYLFDALNKDFCFTLDPCADSSNHKCPKYYTKEQDGLAQDWSGEIVFCNPPYGREIGKWVKKSYDEVYNGTCKCVVMLIPARTDTRWFHEYIYKKADVDFIKGRIKFGDQTENAPFPSMLAIFRKGGDT